MVERTKELGFQCQIKFVFVFGIFHHFTTLCEKSFKIRQMKSIDMCASNQSCGFALNIDYESYCESLWRCVYLQFCVFALQDLLKASACQLWTTSLQIPIRIIIIYKSSFSGTCGAVAEAASTYFSELPGLAELGNPIPRALDSKNWLLSWS